jgi:peptidoglycan hydrolase-like protein with peptidoglycan-binding domain
MRRRNLVVLMVSAVVVSSLATWAAAVQIHSPAEVAARTAPPAASPILVPVVERVLSTKVVTRGTAHFGSPRALRVTPSPLKDGPRIVTSLPAHGAKLTPGDVLATVSGRPVFLLAGRMPAFRDLGPGMSGPDVVQLERSLRRLGLAPGAVDGSYDAATGDAVARLYRRHGFQPVVATEETLSGTRPAEAGLVSGAFAQPGVQLPSDEVVFVGSGPLRVTELPTPVGGKPEGALATVTGSDVVVDGQLRVEQAGRVRPGAKVLVDEPTLGIDTAGRVTSVAGRPGTNGADGFHVSFRVSVKHPPAALVGASVRLTIPIRSTRTAQLTVPVTAVSLGPDGGSRVEKAVDGVNEFVAVRTGLSADGFVSITPKPGTLAAGDHVVVGFQPRPRSGG